MLAQAMHYGLWTVPLLSRGGEPIDKLIDYIHVFMLFLFIPWGCFFLYCLYRFRHRPGHQAMYTPIKAKISKYAEIAVIVIEMVLLVGFSMPVWAKYKNDPPAPSQRLEVRVIAEQFQWDFHYAGKDGKFGPTDSKLITASNPIGLIESHPDAADDIVRVNEFHLPVGTPMFMRLTSKDVIHSFDIPTMRVKQDVIPGTEIPIWFTADEDATTETVRERMTRPFRVEKLNWYKVRHDILAKDAIGEDGKVVRAKGEDMGPDLDNGRKIIEQLREAGVAEIVLQPRNPLEVVCAQLCGNSHFKMKAQMYTHTPAGFAAWVDEASKKVEFKEDF